MFTDIPTAGKAKMIQLMDNKLYKHFYGKLEEAIVSLSVRNKQLTQSREEGYTYKGELYHPKELANVQSWKVNKLHESLEDEHLKQREYFSKAMKERHYVLNFLRNALNECNNINDVILILPSEVHSLISDFLRYNADLKPTITKETQQHFAMKYAEEHHAIRLRVMTTLILE